MRTSKFTRFAVRAEAGESKSAPEPPKVVQEVKEMPTSSMEAKQPEGEQAPKPTKFGRKEFVAIATGVVSVGLGIAYIVASEALGGRELKDTPPEAMAP
eukprot:CAMPEP_0167762594 /NCGR_PEP_ID=MMETSP0110_2-20121227/12864_1 /TAXON_ID=629695 /ORGANISM="Gymnochlora sp., Strain CCMP2014" /LENGTH=98 /DNA_ID=CAMNT_0007649505 /DNA_START=203 /DNA_END=499 /DNA_ORIENTATION=-